MTDFLAYQHKFIPTKYFLTSYRAWSDGDAAVRHLEELFSEKQLMWSEWKTLWIGACAILRASITMFQIDARSCIDERLRTEIRNEWDLITNQREKHGIFWEFLRKERDNIIHEYQWGAYMRWLSEDGKVMAPSLSLIAIGPEIRNSVLMMKGGAYAGRQSIELLRESSEWVVARIYAAISRAGYGPDEYRNIHTFAIRPSLGRGLFGERLTSDPELNEKEEEAGGTPQSQ